EAETEVLPVADQAPMSETPPTEKPRLARGIDLIGRYEGSGFKEAPYIARRADGQVVQLAPLLHLIAELSDGERTNEEIAAAVSEAIQRGVSADNVRQLVDERLRPLGVIAPADGSEPELQKADPLLALKLRAALVPERVVNAITKIFKPLFFPPVIVLVLAGLAAMDVWLFFRLDGYYIVSDLTGVPDMFARIRPTLASLLPWKEASDRVTELKNWVRVVVTAYVFTVVPLLLFMFGMMLINAPRIMSTAYD